MNEPAHKTVQIGSPNKKISAMQKHILSASCLSISQNPGNVLLVTGRALDHKLIKTYSASSLALLSTLQGLNGFSPSFASASFVRSFPNTFGETKNWVVGVPISWKTTPSKVSERSGGGLRKTSIRATTKLTLFSIRFRTFFSAQDEKIHEMVYVWEDRVYKDEVAPHPDTFTWPKVGEIDTTTSNSAQGERASGRLER